MHSIFITFSTILIIFKAETNLRQVGTDLTPIDLNCVPAGEKRHIFVKKLLKISITRF
jgi:hypothetical protein